MQRYEITLHPEAERELVELYDYIADQSDAVTAWNFVEGIREFCSKLGAFPERGTERKDLRSGLRIIGYKRRVSIAFSVNGSRVSILGIFYGGRQIKAGIIGQRE